MSEHSNDARIDSVKRFKRRRDALLNEDVEQLEYHLASLVRLLEADEFIQSILSPLLDTTYAHTLKMWWDEEYEKLDTEADRGRWEFPENEEDEFILQYQLLLGVSNEHERNFMELQNRRNGYNIDRSRSLFLSLIARPFCQSLGDRLESAIGMPSQEARELLAVPVERIPAANETRIFLSHKSENKDRVRRYHRTLQELGYNPWLDESDMPAGTELNRGILTGVNESCAVVFFITEEFEDERTLSDEIDYAKSRRTEQGNKFAIITLKFPGSADVPALLKKYVYVQIDNDLDGIYEIVRALPIELGPVRWKESALK